MLDARIEHAGGAFAVPQLRIPPGANLEIVWPERARQAPAIENCNAVWYAWKDFYIHAEATSSYESFLVVATMMFCWSYMSHVDDTM